MEELSALAPLH
jgi:hypothetical protein